MLEEITTKAAAIAIVVEGRYLTVTDMRACNAYASACHAQLRLIGDPHGGYYDEGRVWHPHVKAPAQATYGLGVGATTVVGPGGSRSRWASGSARESVPPAEGTLPHSLCSGRPGALAERPGQTSSRGESVASSLARLAGEQPK